MVSYEELAEDRSIVIKRADKSSCVVVWDRTDYLLEVEKNLSDSSAYKDVKFGDKELFKLLEESNKMFRRLLSKKCILPEKCKYILYSFKKDTSQRNVNTSSTILRRLPAKVNCIFCLKYIKDCTMSQAAL